MRVEKLLQRFKREFIKVNLIQASLDTLLFFLTANLVLFLLNFQLVSSFTNLQALTGFSMFFFLGDLVYRVQNYRLEIYEEKNPELREVLRTARDNLDQQNIVSQALFDDVLDRARAVTSESIIPNKAIIQKILLVGTLSFLTVLSGIADFQLQRDGGELLPGGDQLKQLISGDKNKEGFELKNSSKIFGETREIDSSDLNLEFNITGTGASESGNIDYSAKVQEEFLLDVSGRSLTEDLELAKRYSLEVKELGG
ncbi:MAG: hypothetical protein ABEI58_00915 [Candidatus Nanohaloarchaea archaeon]